MANDFLTFAAAGGANVLSQADWAALAARGSGFYAGIAKSAEVNKALRQGAMSASQLAQLMADSTGLDVLDDGDAANFLRILKLATRSQAVNNGGTVTGTNTMAVTLSPAPPTLASLSIVPIRLRAAGANTTGVTLNINALGARNLVYPDGQALSAGELYLNRIFEVMYDALGDRYILMSTPLRRLAYNKGVVTLTSPGSSSWLVPAGVYAIYVELCGPGGGGGFGTGTGSGSGGGGGGYDEGYFEVTPASNIPYNIGPGGVGASTSATDGSPGASSTSWNGGQISGTSGQGGQTPSSGQLGNSRAGGAGSSSYQLSGSVSGAGLPNIGGTGGMSPMKGSFPTNNATATGNPGGGPGAGGGGGGPGFGGGTGAPGKIVIRY